MTGQEGNTKIKVKSGTQRETSRETTSARKSFANSEIFDFPFHNSAGKEGQESKPGPPKCLTLPP